MRADENNVWSNFTNQAGIAEINQFIISAGTENSYEIKELSSHAPVFTLTVNGGVWSKIYLFAKCNIICNLDFWLRVGHTTYSDRHVLKSGWDEINGNKMTELKLQLRYKF